MDRQPMPYNQGYIPEEVQRAAAKRAPNTLGLSTALGALGALLFGPPGALIGIVAGGVIGYDRDTKQQRK
jgi:hypothetical protein